MVGLHIVGKLSLMERQWSSLNYVKSTLTSLDLPLQLLSFQLLFLYTVK